jgi:hypothetical protein
MFNININFSETFFNHYAFLILGLSVIGHWWVLQIAKKWSNLRLGPISRWVALGVVFLIGKKLIDLFVDSPGASSGALLHVNQFILAYALVILIALISMGVFGLFTRIKK